MPTYRLSIRNHLLILGVLATVSIWAGAFFQYVALLHESARLNQVRSDLAMSGLYADASQMVARERGLTYGWLSQPSGAPGDLEIPRKDLDGALSKLGPAAGRPLDPAISSRAQDLARQRRLVDRREIGASAEFSWYTDLVSALQDTSARNLAQGMVDVGMPYEHVTDLRRASEFLAQIRGIIYGAISGGSISEADRGELMRVVTLYDEYMRQYELSAPPKVLSRNAATVAARTNVECLIVARSILEGKVPSAVKSAQAWWSLATEAVESLSQITASESDVLIGQAATRMAAVETQMRLTVAALIVLGILALALAAATIGRVVNGLRTLLDGLDEAIAHRRFDSKIKYSKPDEFGRLTSGINQLIAVASTVVGEHEQLSQVDGLTGLLNRRGLDLQINARLNSFRGFSLPTSVLMIDVDHFKTINDSAGHAAGDRVLSEIARLVMLALRPDDIAGRYGGEEILVLLPGCSSNDAIKVAEKIRSLVSQHDFSLGHPVTVSIGVAEWQRESDPNAVVARADAALYQSKGAGRNRVTCEANQNLSDVRSITAA